MRRALLMLALPIVVAVGQPALAAPEDVANDIASRVVSPYCPGVTLHDCPSADAVALRTKIQGWLEDGASRQQVLDRLESEYGTTIHAAPEVKGTGLFAYLLPILGAVLGLAAIVVLARRWSNKGEEEPPPPSISRDDRTRLDAELSAYRGGS